MKSDVFQPGYCRHPRERFRIVTVIDGESRTHQSHADSCDIHKIIARFDRTGVLPPGRGEGTFADVSDLQGEDLTTLIERSNDTRSKVEGFLSARDNSAGNRQLELENEIARLQGEVESLKASQPQGGKPPEGD